MTKPATVVGLGEVLWDLLPSGKQMGGAPANFAYMSSVLGDRGVVASRIGTDDLGPEAERILEDLGLDCSFLQKDAEHPTGTVQVRVDAAGQPDFKISENVAWDFLEWTADWADLARTTDVVCFGSLAQRSTTSQATIRRFLQAVPANTLRVYDVNLRQCFFNRETLHESLQLAHIAKLNDLELPQVARILALSGETAEDHARSLLERYGLRLVCITRGAHGSLLMSERQVAGHSGLSVRVADTIGAGDAFTACLAHFYRRGASLTEINDVCNRFAGWVATQVGGTPSTNPKQLEEILSGIGTG
jgi:fructokinase